MFCSRCGRPVEARAEYCPACGAHITPSATVAAPAAGAPSVMQTGRVRKHLGILAVLWMINGILRLLGVFFFTVLGHAFWAHRWGGWPLGWGAWPFPWGLGWIGGFLGIFGLIHLILAWGLYEKKTWARPLGIVIGFLALIRFPLGTALGIYTIWVLLPEPSRVEYLQIAVP